MSGSIPLRISNKKLTIVYKEQSAYSPASQQKTASVHYQHTSIGLNKLIAFFYYQKYR